MSPVTRRTLLRATAASAALAAPAALAAAIPATAPGDPVQRLALRWEAAQQKSIAASDDPAGWAAYYEITAVEAEIFALPQSSLALVALKLRVLATWMAIEQGNCANYDGVRTSPLEFDEEMLASTLADVERLAGSAS